MKNLLYIVFITLMWCLSLHAYAVNWDKLLVSYETGDTTKITKKYTIAISGVYAFVGDKKREVIVLKHDGNTWKPMQILKPTTTKRVEFGKKITIWNDVVIIEAPKESKNGTIYVYRIVNNRWRRVQKIKNALRRAMLLYTNDWHC